MGDRVARERPVRRVRAVIIGKLLGLILGLVIGQSLIGAVLGLLVGHIMDRAAARLLFGRAAKVSAEARRTRTRGGAWDDLGKVEKSDADDTGDAFFDATFSVMGHVAKADGQVQQSEIALASALMTRMKLSKERRRYAIARFNEGKSPGFKLERVLARLEHAAPRQTALYVSFLQIQMQVAMADGDFDRAEEAVLLEVARLLNVPSLVFRQIQVIARMSRDEGAAAAGESRGDGSARAAGRQGGAGASRAGSTRGSTQGSTQGGGSGSSSSSSSRSGSSSGSSSSGGYRGSRRSRPSLADAFAVLGVPPDADNATTKAAWRREISENHPDKLASQGLPKEMMQSANDRTQTIQKAWDTIRDIKGWR